jgi:hypothetical protein
VLVGVELHADNRRRQQLLNLRLIECQLVHLLAVPAPGSGEMDQNRTI